MRRAQKQRTTHTTDRYKVERLRYDVGRSTLPKKLRATLATCTTVIMLHASFIPQHASNLSDPAHPGPGFLTLDAQAGLALLHRHESILYLQQLSRPAERCQREAVRRVPHCFLSVCSLPLEKRSAQSRVVTHGKARKQRHLLVS